VVWELIHLSRAKSSNVFHYHQLHHLKHFITPPATTPFTDAVLTRSPIDMNAVRFANSVLNDLIANSNGIRSGQYPTRDSIRPGSSVPSSISVTAMSEPT